MPKVRVNCFSVSLDGFGAGPDQSLENPLGVNGRNVHEWVFPTVMFKQMIGEEGGTTGVDNDFALRGKENLGAWILGRNMFTPERGPWVDPDWKGWWGDTPPYHVPTYVLTHYARDPIEMQGGTVFHFVTGGIEEALERARSTAGDGDIRIGGGTETIRQYLKARLIAELHLAIAPVLLGQGEALFAGIDLTELGYAVRDTVMGEKAMHVIIERND